MDYSEIKCEPEKDSENARGLLLEISDRKIQQHITLLFTVFGVFFTFMQVLDYLEIVLGGYFILIVLIVGNIVLYIVGRTFYWVRFNSILFQVKPCKVFMSFKKQKGNYIFSLQSSARFVVINLISNPIARFFSSSNISLKYLGLFTIAEIIGLIIGPTIIDYLRL